jgi:RHH-type proline utilization regulon transcriptional repressor/proline dehydrogenase/delta 1-pyrroline-5-carboxylate dehydrogenase
MAYLVRRLLENTSNDSFLRASLIDDKATEDLLKDPELMNDADPTKSKTDESVDATKGWYEGFRNQPPVDFAVASNRQQMQDAISAVRDQLGRHESLWIGGQAQESESQLRSINPGSTDQLVGTVPLASRTQADESVAAAKAALSSWSSTPVSERCGYVRRAASVMRERLFELAAWEVFECAKGWREATGDIDEAIDFCDYYALGAEAMQRTSGVHVPGERNVFQYLPRGVTAVIAPWNFPLAILTGMTVAALATGNTVVMKPAEQSPMIAAKLMEIFRSVGLPDGVVNFLPGEGEVVGSRLVEHPDVSLIAFTGSRQVGLQINARAAQASINGPEVKRVIAEMGGKNAIIIDSDADLDEAVMGVVKSAFGFQGQKCSACSRVIVLADVHDIFVERLVETARSLRVGPATDPSTSVGPVIDQAAFENVLRYIELGREEGNEVLSVDVGQLSDQGYFVGPHVFTEIESTDRLAQEEVFGPVLAVMRATSLDHAIQVANDSEYALTGGMFSRSPKNLQRVEQELRVGNLYLNRPITGALVGRQPFGGFRMSGIGSKAGGPDYLLQFVVPRTVTTNTMRRGFAPS